MALVPGAQCVGRQILAAGQLFSRFEHLDPADLRQQPTLRQTPIPRYRFHRNVHDGSRLLHTQSAE